MLVLKRDSQITAAELVHRRYDRILPLLSHFTRSLTNERQSFSSDMKIHLFINCFLS